MREAGPEGRFKGLSWISSGLQLRSSSLSLIDSARVTGGKGGENGVHGGRFVKIKVE